MTLASSTPDPGSTDRKIERPGFTGRRLLGFGIVILAGILVSICWIDRPLARFMAQFHRGHAVFTNPTFELPVMTVVAVIWLCLGLGCRFLWKKRWRWLDAAMLAGCAVLAGQFLTHEAIKPIFGRIVPNVYLTTGQYGFEWFHRGVRFGSFPSGHSTEAAAMLSVAWVYYPRWRWLYGTAMIALALALVLGQWHYLSDILAGTVLGVLIGSATVLAGRRV